MLFGKFKSALELSVKQLVIKSRLASLYSLGQAMFAVRKTKCQYFFSNVKIFVLRNWIFKNFAFNKGLENEFPFSHLLFFNLLL